MLEMKIIETILTGSPMLGVAFYLFFAMRSLKGDLKVSQAETVSQLTAITGQIMLLSEGMRSLMSKEIKEMHTENSHSLENMHEMAHMRKVFNGLGGNGDIDHLAGSYMKRCADGK